MYWKLKPQGGSILPKGFIVGNYANQHCILCKFEITVLKDVFMVVLTKLHRRF